MTGTGPDTGSVFLGLYSIVYTSKLPTLNEGENGPKIISHGEEPEFFSTNKAVHNKQHRLIVEKPQTNTALCHTPINII